MKRLLWIPLLFLCSTLCAEDIVIVSPPPVTTIESTNPVYTDPVMPTREIRSDPVQLALTTVSGRPAMGGACTATFGAEILNEANATDDIGAGEADATTGWAGVGTPSVLDSVTTAPQAGTYHLIVTADSNGDGVYRGLAAEGLSTSTIYRLSYYVRHSGTGGTWTSYLTSGAATANTPIGIKNILVTDTTYAEHKRYFLYNGYEDNLVFAELSATNDGTLYVDNASIKAATLCLGSELYTAANAASLSNETDATTGLTVIATTTLSSVETGTPMAGSSQIFALPAADSDGFYIDLSAYMSDGNKYFIRYKTKLETTNEYWQCGLSSDTTTVDTHLARASNTTMEEFGYDITYSASSRYFICDEGHAVGGGDGGLFFDGLSIKQIIGE